MKRMALKSPCFIQKEGIKKKMEKQKTMTEGCIWKNILYFSIPLILGNLFQQLYNTVDSIIVGNYIGSEALAAVGGSGSIINLLVGFCIGASAGAGVVISQFFGAENHNGVKEAVHTTVAIAVVGGAVVSAAGILLAPVMLRAMGTPYSVLTPAVSYLRVFFGGMLFSVIYNMSAGILNAVGNSKRSLIYLIIAAVSNIFLDLLFVIVFDMGVVGVALATDISQFLSCVFIILFLVRSKDSYRLNLKEIKFYRHLPGRILKIGLPTGVQNIVISLSNIVVQSSVNSFGAVAMAGFAAYVKVDGFNSLPVLSFSMAATTFTGQNVGAGKYDRVKKGIKAAVAMAVFCTVFTGILIMIFAPQVMHVFTGQEDVIAYGVYILKFFCPYYWMIGILNVLTGTIRGTGKTLEAMLIVLFSMCIFRVFWIGGVMRISHEISGVMLSYPASWLVGLVLISLYMWKGKWMPKSYYEKS